MILSDKDINYLDTKFQNEFAIPTPNNITPSASGSEGTGSGTNSNGTNSNSNSNSNNGSGNGSSNSNSNGSFSTEGSSTNDYNPDSTLRKCCSRFLDDISFIFPQDTFKIIRPSLDHEMQSRDDLVKERSILAFGAIAQGCYNQVISHLNNVIPFLIRELQHPDKFVRAITCWTLSRYTKFILIDNVNENKEKLFKEFLIEILKKMLDKEHMVREAAMITFQKIITCNPNSVEPYLFDVLRVITSIFFTYTGNNLISVYYILNLLMENYREIFQNQNFVDEIVECLVQKWDELVKNYDSLTLPFFFEVIISLIRVRGYFRVENCKYFLTGCLKIIEINVNEMRNNNYSIINIDKELLIKSINMITALSQNFPTYIKSSSFEKNIIEFLFEIIKLKDINIQNHVIVLFGFLMKADSEILKVDCIKLLEILIPHIEFFSNKKEGENDKLSLCEYSSWTIGLIALYYPNVITNYIDKIFEKIKESISSQKIDESLPKNLYVCIGRLGMVNPEKVNKYLKYFFKSFCLNYKHINDPIEKNDCFKGIFLAILVDFNEISDSFLQVCEMICYYENPPKEIENIFQKIFENLISKDKDKFKNLLNTLTDKIKGKIIIRFKIKID